MLRPIAISPSAAARALALRGAAAASPPARGSIAVRPPLVGPRPCSSRRSLQLCFAEPENKNKGKPPQTKEQKDKAMEQKEKLVKCECFRKSEGRKEEA